MVVILGFTTASSSTRKKPIVESGDLSMLRILTIHPFSGGKLFIDDYVPFQFRRSDQLLPAPHLWRTGNLKTSLLEISIDRDEYTIFGVTLVGYNERLRDGVPQGYDICEIVEGIPVVDVSVLPGITDESVFDYGKIFDDPREFNIYHLRNQFFITWDTAKPQQCIRTDRTGFYVCDSRLCGIGFFDLSSSETNIVVSLLRSWSDY
jgi:hypothetical protein